MRVKMTKTEGAFDKGSVYDVPEELAAYLMSIGSAIKTSETPTPIPANKSMKPAQVRKGGL